MTLRKFYVILKLYFLINHDILFLQQLIIYLMFKPLLKLYQLDFIILYNLLII